MSRNKTLKSIARYLLISVGCLIYAAGIALFLDPNRLAPGGVSGIAIIINDFLPALPTGTLIIILNIPIMIVGWIRFGFRFLLSTLYALALSSVLIDIMLASGFVATSNPLLACVAGAILVSVGIGLVFRAGATTGGTDIIVKLLRLKFRHLNTGVVFLIVDGVVVAASGIAFRDIDTALYAGIAVLVQMLALNMVLYGGDEARLVYIISPKKDIIASRIMNELDAGATTLAGTGAYTGNERAVLMVTLRMRALPQARDIVREEDDRAFMIVTSATSVFGEGFKPYSSDEL